MPVKFSYDLQFGLRIEPELDSELTREEAMIVAVRDLAAGMNSLAQAMWELYDEFRFKEFYDRNAPAPAEASAPGARVATPRTPTRKASTQTRKKPTAARSKKRRK